MSIPFSPSVYEHAAFLIDRTPWEVSRDAELMYRAHREAFARYRHAPIVVGIDIYNLEAEAYGATVAQPSGCGIPAVENPPLASLDAARDLAPYDPTRDGRIAMVIDVGQRLRDELAEADVRIPVSGPFSIAVSLRGMTGLLEDVILAPDDLGRWLKALAENQRAFCRAVAAAGLDVAFFESAAAPPLLSPAQFRQVERPALGHAMGVAREEIGHAVPCVIGGNTTPILDDLLATGTSYVICPAETETDQAAFIDKARQHPEVAVRINLDPHTVSRGPAERIECEVDRILALARHHGGTCLLGTGALPYETPPEHVLHIARYLTALAAE